MSMHHMHTWCPQSLEEDLRSLELEWEATIWGTSNQTLVLRKSSKCSEL